MAYRERQKISQMTPKGADLELTDLLEVSTIENGSYVTKSITGEEIINAAGGTGTVTSVDLTMPSAFSVSGNPITTSGTLAVTGAGTVSQYVRGDGSLANFPSSTGGGASTSYYLNGSISQGTISGVTYYEMNKTPILGTGTDFSINTNGYIASFLTDANDPGLLKIPGGNWNLEIYFSASSGGGTPTFYVELYKYDGSTFSLIASSSTNPEAITGGTVTDAYFTNLSVPETILTATDRLAFRIYVTPVGRTITLHTEDNNLCQIITTFTTGLTALNGLTDQVQNFATGTSGTDFGITSSSATHTFNLPIASATNTGKLSSTDWTTFNNKLSQLTVGTTAIASGTIGRVFFQGSANVLQQSANLFWDNINNRLGIGTSTPTQTLDVSGNSRFQYGTIESGINITGNSGSTTAAIVIGTGTLGSLGALEIWRNGAFALQFFSNIANLGNAYTRLKQGAGLTVTGSGGGSTAANSLTLGSNATDAGVFTATSGTQNTVNIGTSSNDVWSPSSGTATYNLLRINPRINTSGSYNGIVRGVLIDPTLTSSTGVTYRPIETTTGNVIFNSTSGNVAIGGTSFGTSSDKVFAQYTGTAPGSSPVDAFQMYSADVVGGNAAPHFRTENGNIIKLYRETTAVAAATFVANTSLIANDTATFDGYTIGQVVKALRNLGILA